MALMERLANGVLFAGIPWEPDTDEDRAARMREFEEYRARNDAIMAPHLAAIDRSAARAAVEITKRRARAYLARPTALNALDLNLSQASAEAGLRTIERLSRAEPKVARFPINTSLTNLEAARIAFRWARRFERPRLLLAAE